MVRERRSISGLLNGTEAAPAEAKAASVSSPPTLGEGYTPRRPGKPVTADQTPPAPTPPASQQAKTAAPIISASIAKTTHELVDAFLRKEHLFAPDVLNAALADPSVLEHLANKWPAAPQGIPGARRSTRRRPVGGTHQYVFRYSTEGRSFIEAKAQEAGAPSLTAFIDEAMRFYVTSQPTTGEQP